MLQKPEGVKPETEAKRSCRRKAKVQNPLKLLAAKTYATGTPSPAAKKDISRKRNCCLNVIGTGKDGRITKEDAVKAVPSMGTPTEGNRGTSRT